jgi:hypothetical protein
MGPALIVIKRGIVYILRGKRDGATMHVSSLSLEWYLYVYYTSVSWLERVSAATPSILHAIKTYLALHYVSGGV